MEPNERGQAPLLWLTDPSVSRSLYVSEPCEAVLGLPGVDLRRDPRALLDVVVPEDRPSLSRWFEQAGREEAILHLRVARPGGEVREIVLVSYPLPSEVGEGCVAAFAEDARTLPRADPDRRRDLVLQRMPMVLYTAERPESLTADWVGGSVERITGFPAAAFTQKGFWLGRIHPDDRDLVMRTFEGIRASGEVELEYRWLHADGTYRWIGERAAWSGAGEEIVGSGVDITERKEVEEQLRHIDKMESIGRLAGGMAHDFNNLLTVVLGNVDLALGTLRAGHPVRGDLLEIRGAARRAADLTRQLLAFSRRQILSPQDLPLNELVRGLETTIRRLVGDSVSVSVSVDPAAGLVHADPGQLEQAVLNLALNARDAMPDGGRLFLETRDRVLRESSAVARGTVPPGRYAVLSVRDEGCGMSPEVQERIFEPFFTTKEPGQGTGLGLATVYGIVTQSGGHVTFRSEPARGTCFEIYLPIARPTPATEAAPEPSKDSSRGGETVLLVEDESAVRNLARRILSRAGFQVIASPSPVEALAIAGELDRRIDALVTDLVMPGLDGAELARRVADLRPGIRILFMSGYTDVWPRQVHEDSTVAHLEKPFTSESLIESLRRILDAPGRPG